MIFNFKQSWLKEFWNTGENRRVPPQLKERLLRKLDILNSAWEIRDLNAVPSNHLHALHGEREGQWSISVNGPWRICFRFEDDQIFDVELVQYH
jgi:proteic killer suppression protein